MTATPKTLEALDEVRKTLCRIQQRHQAVGYKFDRIWDLIDAARAELAGLEQSEAAGVADEVNCVCGASWLRHGANDYEMTDTPRKAQDPNHE